MIRTLLAALLLITSCAHVQAVNVKSLPDIDRMLGATVVLWDPITSHTYCSGVVIAGHIWTAAHCIKTEAGDVEQIIWLKYFDGLYDTATVIRHNDNQDWAELQPTRDVVGVSRAKDGPTVGEDVWSLGHPAGLEYTVLHGLLAAKKRNSNGLRPGMVWWQLSISAYAGNSGGPVFNARGEVFGIVSFIHTSTWDFTGAADITSI